MTIEQAKKLMRLHQAGFIVQVRSGYVDSPINLIYEDENGDISFDSGIWSRVSLTMYCPNSITVSKPLADWWNQPIG